MAVQPRMGMPPPGQPIGQQTVQPTIVLGRPGQPGSSAVQVNAAGGQIVRQQFVQPGGIRVQGPGMQRPATHVPTVAGGGGNVVINQPGSRPGQPGSQITVPLQALQGLQPGQGIPTGQAGHLLVKTDNGQYQILRVGGSTNATASPTTAITSTPGMPPPTGLRTSTPGQLPTQPLPQQMSANVISTQSGLRPQVHTMAPPRPLAVGPPATVVTSTPSNNQSSTPAVTSAQPPVSNSSRSASSSGGMGGQMTPDTAKMKCKNFLATLLRLAGEQPQDVANNVRTLIQGLIDGQVEPEIFTTRLQKELNSSPQPCLVPFLKKSLPYLQNSLASGELSIEGVRAPPRNSLRMPGGSSPQSLVGAGALGVRSTMSLPRPTTSNVIYQTSRPPASVIRPRGQSPVTTTVVRPSLTQSPLPVSQLQNAASSRATKTVLSPNITSPSLSTKGLNKYQPTAMNTRLPTTPLPIPLTGKSSTPFATKTMIQSPLGQPFGQSPKLSVSFSSLQPTPPSSHASSKLSTPSLSSTLSSASLQGTSAPTLKYPDKKSSASSSSYSATGDEDINDVAAMGGVNLAEETQRMAATDLIGNQVLRSCKDETFLQTGLLSERISRICRNKGLEAPPPEVVALVSHATQERLKTLLEKLSVVAEHRLDIVKATDEGDKYEVTQDVRGQLKFLNDLEKIERKRHDEAERELLFRAAKSRTKTEDPEKEKLKAKAKELQRLEEEQLRHEKANNTARLAIGGPRKRLKLDGSELLPGSSNAIGGSGIGVGSNLGSFSGNSGLGNRPRTKRVHLRDLLFLMEQEKELKRSPLLWKSYSS